MDTAREVMVRSSHHLDEDLTILAEVHGLSPTGAIREGLSLLFSLDAEFGEDGFLVCDPPHHAKTLRAMPEDFPNSEPNNVTFKVRLAGEDDLLVTMLCDTLEAPEADVIRHAIHVARTLYDQTLMGGHLKRFGALA